MRLAVFTNQYPSRVSTFFARDMRALIEAGVEIDIFPVYPLDPSLWQYVPEILGESIHPRTRVHHTGLRDSLGKSSHPDWQAPPGFSREVRQIASAAMPYGPAPLAKSLYVLPKAYAWAKEFHGCFDHVLGYWGSYPGTCAYAFHRLDGSRVPFSLFLHAGADLFRPRERAFLRQKLCSAQHVITCSEFSRNFLLDLYPELQPELEHKLFLYHHGLDFAEFPFQPDERLPRRIVAVGRMDAEKGFDLLLSAAAELNDVAGDLEIEFVGDGPQLNRLRKQADALGLGGRVIFRGWQSFSEVQEAMKRATLLVHPSPVIGDGIPNVLKEAAALGTPVIATNISGLPEAVDYGKSGVLVPPHDPIALAEAILRLVEHPELRRELSFAGRRYAEKKFDLWKNGRELADLFCKGANR